MAKIDELVISYALYEDSVEYMGTTEVTLPDIEFLTAEIAGAGIAGNVTEVVIGHMNAMTTTFNFRTIGENAGKLIEPRIHTIDLRVAQQQWDGKSSVTSIGSVKHIMKVKPKKITLGKASEASTADVSGEYAVFYYAMYIDNKIKTEIDPFNYVCKINGKDYLSEVKKALGRS